MDDEVKILDENGDEQTLEEKERNERLKKLKKKPKDYTRGAILMKVVCVIAVFGVIFSIFFHSGVMISVSLIVLAISSALHYFFF